jgi:feruloyl esterase
VLKQCDEQDSVKDSIISDLNCDFRPERLLCEPNGANGTESGCLTKPQINTLRKVYSDWVTSNGTFIFPHYAVGSEAEFPSLFLSTPEPVPAVTGYFEDFLNYGPDWDYYTFNESSLYESERANPGNATVKPNLSAFQKKGGKLLMYHGMTDGVVPTGSSVQFYDQLFHTMHLRSSDLNKFLRFFLVPGMNHCGGTPSTVNAPWYFAGPDQPTFLGPSVHSTPGFEDTKHDVLLAMMAWVENGTAPDEIIATKYVNETEHAEVQRQRPLCMYPKRAKYIGGDMDKAESWRCA